VAGEFVWTGFDYIGEPTPYGGNGGARSSYFGIVDLAGFKKDRFYLYQARWRPGTSNYRFRWDSVKYNPGELQAVAYKNGAQWAVDSRKTAGNAAALNLTVDRSGITGDGLDLAYVSVAVVDFSGTVVPRAANTIIFAVSGPGKLAATDNGDPTDMTAFPSASRKAFSGLAMGIVKAEKGKTGQITVIASASGLTQGHVTITVT
jgi:beta-galactosidase